MLKHLFMLASIWLVAPSVSANDLLDVIKQQEQLIGGRLGAYIVDTETGKTWQYRADERFPLMSTFKTFACAAMLQQSAGGKLNPETRVAFDEQDLIVWSPITKDRTGGDGMSLNEFCAATLSMSDNTAANMILEAIGGPQALTDYFQNIGDDTSRLDRIEPFLNEAKPGDERDTTTPKAVAGSLQNLLTGTALPDTDRKQLTDWMKGHKLGDQLFRKHLPEGWRIAERTGAGGNGSRGYTAIIWPTDKKPIAVAIYMTETNATMQERNAVIAEISLVLLAQN